MKNRSTKKEKVKDEKSFPDSLIKKLNEGVIDKHEFLKIAAAAGLTVLSDEELKEAGDLPEPKTIRIDSDEEA